MDRRSPAVQASLLTRSQTASLVNHQFRSYYSQYAATAFAFKVWTNNVWVAAEALIFGVLLGVPTLYVLLQNALNLGVDGGLLIGHGRATEFFALILRTDAGAVGGVPGRRGRAAPGLGDHRPGAAAAQPGAGRGGPETITIAIGLIVVLGVWG